MGQNLPGVGETTTPDQDRALVDGIFAQNRKEHQAVFYTHIHPDHIGLFSFVPEDVPQFMGEGGKEIMIAKYGSILETDKLMDKVNHLKLKEDDRT